MAEGIQTGERLPAEGASDGISVTALQTIGGRAHAPKTNTDSRRSLAFFFFVSFILILIRYCDLSTATGLVLGASPMPPSNRKASDSTLAVAIRACLAPPLLAFPFTTFSASFVWITRRQLGERGGE